MREIKYLLWIQGQEPEPEIFGFELRTSIPNVIRNGHTRLIPRQDLSPISKQMCNTLYQDIQEIAIQSGIIDIQGITISTSWLFRQLIKRFNVFIVLKTIEISNTYLIKSVLPYIPDCSLLMIRIINHDSYSAFKILVRRKVKYDCSEVVFSLIKHNKLEWLKYLVNTNDVDLDGSLPIAIYRESADIMEYLYDLGLRNFEIFNDKLFPRMCIQGKLYSVQFMTKLSVSIEDVQEGFHHACSYGRLNVVQYLIDTYPNINIQPGLAAAVILHRLEICQYLTQRIKIKIDYSDIVNPNLELCSWLFQYQPPSQNELNNLMEKVCGSGPLEVVQLIHQKGGRISIEFLKGSISNARILKYLVQNGADLMEMAETQVISSI